MKHFPLQTLLALFLVALGGCASSSVVPVPPLTAEARREPVTSHPESLNRRLESLVMADASLTPERKNELLKILRKLAAKNEEVQTLMNQKKSLMLKELLSKPYRKKRMQSLRRSLLDLNEQRANNSIKALEEIKDVLGHQDHPEAVMEKVMEGGGRF